MTRPNRGSASTSSSFFSTYYGNDSRLNISPKGFTGEKYGGATYWDTEAYCLPVYLGVADPQVAKNLLYYRYHQLPGAYVNAKEQGVKGGPVPDGDLQRDRVPQRVGDHL